MAGRDSVDKVLNTQLSPTAHAAVKREVGIPVERTRQKRPGTFQAITTTINLTRPTSMDSFYSASSLIE